MKKNKVIISILLLCMITAIMGCSSSEEKKKTINFLNYGANIDEESLELFEEKYNIAVNEETFDDMEQMYTKVSSGAVKYDVILVSDNLMKRMIDEGLLQELDKDNIPNLKEMDSTYMDLDIDKGNKYSVPYMFGTVGIIYNTDYVDEPVDSWDILWNEKYKGEIFMFDTYRDTMGAALKKLGYSMNSTDENEINAARDLLIDQKPLVEIYGVDIGTETIASGDTYINMIWSGEGLNLEEEYDNLKYIVPKEGANFWIDSLCIPSNSENKKEAEKLINFLSGKDAQYRIADEIGYVTPNKLARAMQPDNIKNNPNAYYDQEFLDKCEMYEDLDKKTKELYDEAWNEIKSK